MCAIYLSLTLLFFFPHFRFSLLWKVTHVSNVLWKQHVFGPGGLNTPKQPAWQKLTAKKSKKRRKKGDPSPLKPKPKDYPALLGEATKGFLWSGLKGCGGFAGKNCFPLNLCLHAQVTTDLAFTVIPVLVVVWVLDWRSLPNYLWHFEGKEGANP